MTFLGRRLRLQVFEALDARARQFRSHDDVWPFRVPHEPLQLQAIVDAALAGEHAHVDPIALRSRRLLRMEWEDGSTWEAWAMALPSGVSLYCDSGPDETRVLASAKRSHPAEADRFFLERLAESRGHAFGIEMSGAPPDRIRTPLTDRDFLTDLFVELFEGTPAEGALRGAGTRAPEGGRDFRDDVRRWLARVLVAPPPPAARPNRRPPRRLRDEQ
ncbi:MAG TPA: hypothetical protein VFX12_02805 [Vicinamibacterales bacterium]|nr:hypothetical protein [Vicinamibacterales bacterium]